MRFFITVIFSAFALGSPRVFAADDLITADKTLFVQFAIFLVALYLLNILFFRPLVELADRREKATSGSGKEADELVKKAEEMTGQYSAALSEARNAALEERARITKSALAEAEKIVFSAREEAHSIFEKRAAELSVQTEKARAEMKSEVETMTAMIVQAVEEPKDV